MEAAHIDAAVTIAAPEGRRGRLWIVGGNIVDAEWHGVRGEPAACEMLALDSGVVWIDVGRSDPAAAGAAPNSAPEEQRDSHLESRWPGSRQRTWRGFKMVMRRDQLRNVARYALGAVGFFCVSALVVGVSLRLGRSTEPLGQGVEPAGGEQVNSLLPPSRDAILPAEPAEPPAPEEPPVSAPGVLAEDVLTANRESMPHRAHPVAAHATAASRAVFAPRATAPIWKAPLSPRLPLVQPIDAEPSGGSVESPRQAPRVRVIEVTTPKVKVIE